MIQRIVLVIGLTCFGLAQGVASDGNTEDAVTEATLAGDWTLVSLGFDGYELRSTSDRPLKVTFAKDQMVTSPGYELRSWMSVTVASSGWRYGSDTELRLSKKPMRATYKLNTINKPTRIDVQEYAGRNRKGICRLVDGELEICLVTGDKYPTEFKSGDECVLLTLSQEKKK